MDPESHMLLPSFQIRELMFLRAEGPFGSFVDKDDGSDRYLTGIKLKKIRR